MASKSAIHTAIDNLVKQNGIKAITGTNLNGLLKEMLELDNSSVGTPDRVPYFDEDGEPTSDADFTRNADTLETHSRHIRLGWRGRVRCDKCPYHWWGPSVGRRNFYSIWEYYRP